MSLIPVSEALSRILNGVVPLDAEETPISECLGRVLAENLKSRRTQPPFDASAMDGYAVRSADFADAKLPVELKLIGQSAAGHAFDGAIGPGETVRIFTGAIVPEGADAILIQENAEADGKTVTAKESVESGRYIRKKGLDFSKGDELIDAGTQLRARHVSLAAAMNYGTINVIRRPHVGVLATGDELVPPGNEPGPGQIISSNNVGLRAVVTRLGGYAVDLGIAPDDEEALINSVAMARDTGLDVLVTLGGASVGDHDLVLGALEKLGMKLDFWRIAMRPGKPLMFGDLDGMRVLGLPGNPVSAMVCSEIFLRPLIRAMLGLPTERNFETAILESALPENDQRQDYLRAEITGAKDGQTIVRPFSRQDSSMLAALARADCLIVREPFAAAAGAGETVKILPLDRA